MNYAPQAVRMHNFVNKWFFFPYSNSNLGTHKVFFHIQTAVYINRKWEGHKKYNIYSSNAVWTLEWMTEETKRHSMETYITYKRRISENRIRKKMKNKANFFIKQFLDNFQSVDLIWMKYRKHLLKSNLLRNCPTREVSMGC